MSDLLNDGYICGVFMDEDENIHELNLTATMQQILLARFGGGSIGGGGGSIGGDSRRSSSSNGSVGAMNGGGMTKKGGITRCASHGDFSDSCSTTVATATPSTYSGSTALAAPPTIRTVNSYNEGMSSSYAYHSSLCSPSTSMMLSPPPSVMHPPHPYQQHHGSLLDDVRNISLYDDEDEEDDEEIIWVTGGEITEPKMMNRRHVICAEEEDDDASSLGYSAWTNDESMTFSTTTPMRSSSTALSASQPQPPSYPPVDEEDHDELFSADVLEMMQEQLKAQGTRVEKLLDKLARSEKDLQIAQESREKDLEEIDQLKYLVMRASVQRQHDRTLLSSFEKAVNRRTKDESTSLLLSELQGQVRALQEQNAKWAQYALKVNTSVRDVMETDRKKIIAPMPSSPKRNSRTLTASPLLYVSPSTTDDERSTSSPLPTL